MLTKHAKSSEFSEFYNSLTEEFMSEEDKCSEKQPPLGW
jgi:hypothetical protein